MRDGGGGERKKGEERGREEGEEDREGDRDRVSLWIWVILFFRF